MKLDRATVPLVVLVAAETVHSAGEFGPNVKTLFGSYPGEHDRARMRGAVCSGAWSLTIAIFVSVAVGEPWPIAVWLLATVAVLAAQEWADRADPDVA